MLFENELTPIYFHPPLKGAPELKAIRLYKGIKNFTDVYTAVPYEPDMEENI